MKMKETQRGKRIRWVEEHIEQTIAERQADQVKYPGSGARYEGEEAGLKQALFIFRCYLRPDHPDVRAVEVKRAADREKEAA